MTKALAANPNIDERWYGELETLKERQANLSQTLPNYGNWTKQYEAQDPLKRDLAEYNPQVALRALLPSQRPSQKRFAPAVRYR